MKILSHEMMPELMNVEKGICLSLYMPTHRSHPDNLLDPILYKNLVKDLENSILQKYTQDEATKMLEPFVALADNQEFWNHTLDGVAVLGSKDFFKAIYIPVSTEELTVAADSFHTKPLRKYLQSVERYNILGLSLHDYHIYEGNRHSLTELVLPTGTPLNIKEALGDELTEKYLNVAAYGGVKGAGGGGYMHHGHGSKADEVDIDADRFFRFVAKTIDENFSSLSGLPLILAALPEHHNLFHKVSEINSLLPNGIDVNPKSIDSSDLIKRAWDVMEPYYNTRIEEASGAYLLAKSQNKASEIISEVAVAAAEGKVDILIIEADRQIPGKIKSDTGTIEKGNLSNPETDDLLDDLGELVTKMGGKVMVIPSDKMPSTTGVACIYRY